MIVYMHIWETWIVLEHDTPYLDMFHIVFMSERTIKKHYLKIFKF